MSAESSNAAQLTEPVTNQDHAIGSPSAPITIVEYGDYECPDCLNAIALVKQVRERLGDRARFVFRHFPQSSVHKNASAAAEAVEAAAEQGKFWEMHEALFKHQKELSDIDLSHLALTVGVEIYKFESSREGERHHQRVAADLEGGRRSGVHKTPTFFINGRRFDGKLDVESLVTAAGSGL